MLVSQVPLMVKGFIFIGVLTLVWFGYYPATHMSRMA